MAAVVLVAASCGGGSGLVLEAKYPTEPQTLEPDTGLTVRVVSVTDGRQFEDEATKLSQEAVWGEMLVDRSRIVGAREKGKALENIQLAAGQSIEAIVQDIIEVAFRQAGYRVVDEGEADLTVQATVSRFWTWMTPEAMTMRVESSMQVSVMVSAPGGQSAFEVAGYHDSRDVGKSPESYRFAMNEALFDLYTNTAVMCLEVEVTPAAEPEEEP
jgi:hypothetical protein